MNENHATFDVVVRLWGAAVQQQVDEACLQPVWMEVV